ncbi:DUF4139 domain-containing protein [Billgrantia zhangzhouensis]|nr:DUF4139 domain-containing protein [Halomonas zhangzhouensis]
MLAVLNKTLIRACVVVAMPAGLAFAQDDTQHRIEAVTLSSGGLAEIRRSVRVDGAAEFGFDVPLDQVDDVLKSLVVRDPAGGVASVTLDGLSPVEETFRHLPFSPDDLNALPRLLDALQGITVRASSGGRTVEGTVLGVETTQRSEEGGAGAEALLSVMTEEDRIAVLRLRPDTELDILDTEMRENLREAAVVSGRGRMDDMRTIAIALEGDGTRDLLLDYVVPAPVWKTAYRLLLDDGDETRLQAWAVIENATGEDWRSVAVTLSSGAPVTLTQRLHQRYWHVRPEIPVMAQTAVPPQPDRFRGVAAEKAQNTADQAALPNVQRMAVGQAAAPAPGPSAPVALATAAEGEAAAIYRLPAPVDLPVGRTLSVPFIDTELTAERISLFQPERDDVHPVSALRIENTTGVSLPPGIVTIYAPDEEGYAGDAQLSGLPTGESRMVSFAADRKVEVMTEAGRDESVYRASLGEGVLRATRITRATTIYRIQGAKDAPRTIVIEHPRRQGWHFSSDVLEEHTPTYHRLRVEVEAGSSAEVAASHERTETESIALVEADTDTLVYWSGRIDDSRTADMLADLVERRREIARAETQVEVIGRELARTSQNQARIRENLAAVPEDSTLSQRYVSMLEEEEDRITELDGRHQQAEQRLAELREGFATSVREL